MMMKQQTKIMNLVDNKELNDDMENDNEKDV